MKSVRSVLLVGLVLFSGMFTTVHCAWADGISLNSLNPFAGNSSKSTTTPLLNGKPIHPATTPPSLWSRMSNGTKNLATKTKNMLTFSKKPAPPKNQLTLGTQPAQTNTASGTSTSWNPFASKPAATAKPNTVSDFIGMPRPQP